MTVFYGTWVYNKMSLFNDSLWSTSPGPDTYCQQLLSLYTGPLSTISGCGSAAGFTWLMQIDS